MKKIADAMRTWGPVGVSLFTAVIVGVLAFAYFGVPRAYEAVDSDGPAIPHELIDHANERAGLERGSQYGATPSQALPRPSHLANYTFHASPNWSSRGTCGVQAIVIHVTGPGSMAGMASWFKNPASQVSAHFGIGKNGELHQYVEMGDAAWHAGILNRPDLSNPLIAQWVRDGINPNRCHIGIELLLGGPAEPLVDYPLMEQTLTALLAWISQTTGVPLDRTHVIGHYQIDGVNRASDPKCCVDFDRVLHPFSAVPDEYCCKQDYGGEFNITRSRWEWRPEALFIWVEENPVWTCIENCP